MPLMSETGRAELRDVKELSERRNHLSFRIRADTFSSSCFGFIGLSM